jgi:preprotein translocase subunit YajC
MTDNMVSILLQGSAPAPGGGFTFPLMMVGMIVVMYFFMIRPQQKRAKEQKKFVESTGTGDKVVTTSGIHGRIIRTNDDGTVVLEIDRNTQVTVERQAISMEMTAAYNKRSGTANAVTTETK